MFKRQKNFLVELKPWDIYVKNGDSCLGLSELDSL